MGSSILKYLSYFYKIPNYVTISYFGIFSTDGKREGVSHSGLDTCFCAKKFSRQSIAATATAEGD
jgi:hypothetical protein